MLYDRPNHHQNENEYYTNEHSLYMDKVAVWITGYFQLLLWTVQEDIVKYNQTKVLKLEKECKALLN